MSAFTHHPHASPREQDLPTSNKKIMHKDGKYYLLPLHQSIAELSLDEQHHAHQAYLQIKPRLEAPQRLMDNGPASPLELTEIHSLLQDQQLIANQRTTAQAFMAQVAALNESTNPLDRTTPTLTLTPSSTRSPSPAPQAAAKRVNPASSYASCLYRLELRKMKQMPEPHHPRDGLNNTALTATPQQNKLNPLQIRPGVALSPLLMQAILRLNNGALAQQLETINSLTHEHFAYKSPSPLSTKPQGA